MQAMLATLNSVHSLIMIENLDTSAVKSGRCVGKSASPRDIGIHLAFTLPNILLPPRAGVFFAANR